MHEVTRTCVGCRQRRPQSEMLRLRRRPDGVVVWAGVRPTGRSAYLCLDRACVEHAQKRRAFSRAFRGNTVKGAPDDAVAGAAAAVKQAITRERGASHQTSVRVRRLEALAQRITDVVAPSRDTTAHPKGGPSHG